jgi:predicted phage terminase large subunit-like protein
MNYDDRLRRKKKAKLDIAYFVQEYLGYTLASFQKELLRNVLPNYLKVLFTVSRNTGKTDVVLAPCIMHTHLFNPNKSSLLTSRSNDLIKKIINYIDGHFTNNDLLIDDFAYELSDYKRINNDLIFNSHDDWSSKQYTIEARSIDSSLTGNHYDYLWCDDLEDDKSVLTPHSRQKTKDFYNTTIEPLLNPGAKQVASGTFKHLDDIYNSWINSKTWFHYQAPIAPKMPESWTIVYDENGVAVDVENIKGEYELLFPERWNIKNIILKIASIGRVAFEREFQNNIKILQGTTLNPNWIRKCAITKEASEKYGVELIPPLKNLEIYQGVDPAIGVKQQNDYFVVETIGVQRFPEFKIFVLDWYRDKIGFPMQIKIMQKLRYSSLSPIWNGKLWNVLKTTVESNAYQLALAQQLISITDMNIKPEVSTGNKEAEIIANSTKFENGQIWLPIDHPHYHDFEREYLNFPKGAHDDMLDANKKATTSIIPMIINQGMQVAGA